LEEWGLGILGLDRFEFYSATLPEIRVRIGGYLKRVTEYENIGTRRLYGLIHGGFTSLGGGRQLPERILWPMSIDKIGPKRDIPKSEDLVEKDRALILHIWPDAKIKEVG
jgi:hypothetical protein